jgi:hypothetical protein
VALRGRTAVDVSAITLPEQRTAFAAGKPIGSTSRVVMSWPFARSKGVRIMPPQDHSFASAVAAGFRRERVQPTAAGASMRAISYADAALD